MSNSISSPISNSDSNSFSNSISKSVSFSILNSDSSSNWQIRITLMGHHAYHFKHAQTQEDYMPG